MVLKTTLSEPYTYRTNDDVGVENGVARTGLESFGESRRRLLEPGPPCGKESSSAGYGARNLFKIRE